MRESTKYEWGKFDAFGRTDIRELLESQKMKIKNEIKEADENYILNISVDKYTEFLDSKYRIDDLIIHFDERTAEPYEDSLSKEKYLRGANIANFYPRIRTFVAKILRYYFPMEGNYNLLNYRPTTWISYLPLVCIQDNFLCIDIILHGKNPETIKNEANHAIECLTILYDNIRSDVSSFNASIPNLISKLIEERKNNILRDRDFLQKLEVPIRKKLTVAQTFSIPDPKLRKKIIIQTHDNHIKELSQNDENWLNYKFHIPGDVNREVMLAIMMFHVPKS